MASRAKMSREDRAKQFMPFAALKGYPEALRKKEQDVYISMLYGKGFKKTRRSR